MAWDDGLEGAALDFARSPAELLRALAGPGTGKTHALLRRLTRIIENGCPPEETLVLTFARTAAVDILTPFASFDEYWQPFLGGQGPAPAYVTALDAAARSHLRDHLQKHLPIQPDGSIPLTARAWSIRATVEK